MRISRLVAAFAWFTIGVASVISGVLWIWVGLAVLGAIPGIRIAEDAEDAP